MKQNDKNYVQKLSIGGLLLAIGILLPKVFHMMGQPALGQMFLPMHLGVFIAGLFLGKYYGLWIGFLTPLLNSLFGMPMFPMNIIMAFELGAYGFFSGLFMEMYLLSKITVLGKNLKLHISLILSMLVGRIVYSLALLTAGELFGLEVPKPVSIIAATISGIPGILLQLILIPIIVFALNKSTNKR